MTLVMAGSQTMWIVGLYGIFGLAVFMFACFAACEAN